MVEDEVKTLFFNTTVLNENDHDKSLILFIGKAV